MKHSRMKALTKSPAMLIPLVCLALSASARQAPESSGSAQVVDRLETMLVEHMKAGDSMSFEARFKRLRPLVEDIMAVDRMGRFLFGRDWPAFEPEQRDRFTDAFLDLSAATYANQFDRFNGERFDPIELQQQGEDRAVVRRQLTTGSGSKIAFDYLLTHAESGWRIVTIITDGVSDLAMKRSQYSRILENDGFDAVIDHIREATDSQRGD